jgi:hypothetical protein
VALRERHTLINLPTENARNFQHLSSFGLYGGSLCMFPCLSVDEEMMPLTWHRVTSHASWIINAEQKLSDLEGWKLYILLSCPNFPSPAFTIRVCRFSTDTSRRSARLGIWFFHRGLMEYHCASDSWLLQQTQRRFLYSYHSYSFGWVRILRRLFRR